MKWKQNEKWNKNTEVKIYYISILHTTKYIWLCCTQKIGLNNNRGHSPFECNAKGSHYRRWKLWCSLFCPRLNREHFPFTSKFWQKHCSCRCMAMPFSHSKCNVLSNNACILHYMNIYCVLQRESARSHLKKLPIYWDAGHLPYAWVIIITQRPADWPDQMNLDLGEKHAVRFEVCSRRVSAAGWPTIDRVHLRFVLTMEIAWQSVVHWPVIEDIREALERHWPNVHRWPTDQHYK